MREVLDYLMTCLFFLFFRDILGLYWFLPTKDYNPHYDSSLCLITMPHHYASSLPTKDYNPTEGKVSLSEMVKTAGGKVVLIGLVVALYGIYLVGRAGVLKTRERALQQQQQQQEQQQHGKARIGEAGAMLTAAAEAAREEMEEAGRNFWPGLGVATVSGFTSAFMNFGIEAGKPLADECIARG